jgi:hypothetical protein
VGVAIPTLDITNNGTPEARTRKAPVTHLTFTQEPVGHPVIIEVEARERTGWPEIRTRGSNVAGLTIPPCAHRTTSAAATTGTDTTSSRQIEPPRVGVR